MHNIEDRSRGESVRRRFSLVFCQRVEIASRRITNVFTLSCSYSLAVMLIFAKVIKIGEKSRHLLLQISSINYLSYTFCYYNNNIILLIRIIGKIIIIALNN